MNKVMRDEIPSVLGDNTDRWKRVDVKAIGHVREEAINLLSAIGYLEVRIVATVRMGKNKMPRSRYVGGGPWWSLIEGELDRLVPPGWYREDGQPKENLTQGASVIATRLTDDGVACFEAIQKTPKVLSECLARGDAEPLLRCDGIEKSKKKTPTAWYHDSNEQRPTYFAYGPLSGTMKDLDHALGGKDKNGRQIKGKNKRGKIWAIRQQRTAYVVWFTSQADYNAAYRKLDSLKVDAPTASTKTKSRK